MALSYGEHNLDLHSKTHRDHQLPPIWEAFNHPLHPTSNPGRTFMIKLKPTMASMSALADFETKLEVPKGRKQDLDRQGFLELVSGDYLFGRNEFGSQDPMDDVVLAWVVGRELQTPEKCRYLSCSTENALGLPETRTFEKVRCEEVCQLEPVHKDGGRCYSIATSFERQRSAFEPAANVKSTVRSDEALKLLKDLSAAVMPMAMRNMEMAPAHVQEIIKRRFEYLELPRISFHGNWAYPVLQCNIAAAEAGGDLSKQMGFFGGAHFDEGDDPCWFTNMITSSSLPDDYDPGYFFLLVYGVYTRLSNGGGFNFHGNVKHGGSGPFPPRGEKPPPSAYRLTLISYPPERAVDPTKTRHQVLASSWRGTVMNTPEMRYPGEGLGLMDHDSYAEFAVQNLYQLLRYASNQLSPQLGLRMEKDDFFRLFSYLREDGNRIQMEPWQHAPPFCADDESLTALLHEREKSEREWEAYYLKTAVFIPYRFDRDPKLQQAWPGPPRDSSDITLSRPFDSGINSAKYAFLLSRNLNVHNLELELLQLKEELQATQSPTAPSETAGMVDTICQAKEVVALPPTDVHTLEEIGKLLLALKSYQNATAQQAQTARAGRISIVEARTRVWRWIEYTVPTLAGQILDGKRAECLGSWVADLANTCFTVLHHQHNAKEFNSQDYGVTGQGERVWLYENKRPRVLSIEEAKEQACIMVSQIVAYWLNVSPDVDQKLCWFVMVLMETIGLEAVSMDHVWKMVCHFTPAYVVLSSGRNAAKATSRESAKALKNELQQHPISNPSTKEGYLYLQYQDLLNRKLRPEDVDPHGFTCTSSSLFAHMWRLSLQYIEDPDANPSDAFSNLLREDADFYLPIREAAPTRIRACGSDGPYHPTTIVTLPGIFSAIVLRAFTYRSKFFWDRRMVFHSWEDLDQEIMSVMDDHPELSLKSGYFTNFRSYGVPVMQRTIDKAKQSWLSLQERGWNDYCANNPKKSFLSTLRYFRPQRHESKIFPYLGALGGFALTCDLAYAGVCQRPTVDEMAECIVELDKGALSGLRLLGLVEVDAEETASRGRKVEAVKEALHSLAGQLKKTLRETEQSAVGLMVGDNADWILLEHSLCKFSQALNKKALSM
ncbi:hypothetical protein H1R20_g14570, partial [Candolleomyces eurysporus]